MSVSSFFFVFQAVVSVWGWGEGAVGTPYSGLNINHFSSQTGLVAVGDSRPLPPSGRFPFLASHSHPRDKL